MDRAMSLLLTEAFRDPRRNGARIAAWPLGGAALWMALVLVAILAVLGLYALAWLAGMPLNDVMPSPLAIVGVQAGTMLILSWLTWHVGRWFGGTGSNIGALRVMIWLQALMVLMQAVQLVILLVLPPLASIAGVVALVASGWLAGGLIAGLHGFRSIGATFFGALVTLIGFAFLLSLVLSPFLPPLP